MALTGPLTETLQFDISIHNCKESFKIVKFVKNNGINLSVFPKFGNNLAFQNSELWNHFWYALVVIP